ncbi:putative chromo domain-containing protein [Rosellinia necatrix]|uniref:Putative chromo domain-containing protein n=1 Tax=Rosellinia necatrix TaxID=77044 RepID=A0A1W2TSE0_ROSNE|nr:putative chromo domain-containing protein [Rosellinia necatrix]
MASLLNFWNSPNKQPKTGSVNGAAPDPRGTKRKAKPDPYDAMDDDDDDDDEVIPARKTPTSQRTARSRLSSATPGSGTKPRVSLTGKRRPGRRSLKSQQGDVSDPAAASPTGPETIPSRAKRAKASDSSRMPSNSRVPEAPMGDSELLGNGAADAPVLPAPKLQPATLAAPSPQAKGKAKPTDVLLTRPAQAEDEDEDEDEEAEEEEEEEEEEEGNEDTREEHEIARLLKHRMASDKSGAVELLVQWVDEHEGDATWEGEAEIQEGAAEILYEYWKSQGGRINALFHKPNNPPPEIYHVFKVLRHEKKNRGGFQFEVQWVGHPPTRGETSMEAETKLKTTAPELLHEYWESVGGRASHLAPRGRAKKARTE